MNSKYEKLSFSCDYLKGAHPRIMQRLIETNMEKTPGYGLDVYSEEAKEKIRMACAAPGAEVKFLVGGTQTNSTVIDAFLRSYQGVLAAETGHINVHEAGTIEAGGHKVLALPHKLGKLEASTVASYLRDFFADDNFEHAVIPGMVYLSQPTEYGTLYTKEELTQLRNVCDEYELPLYVDGARLAYALSAPENDVSLPDLARLCDAFYIGGTKCGALFGEAVVIPKPQQLPYFFTIIKQHGALLAKGRLLGLQFSELFTDNLYIEIGKNAIETAKRLRQALKDKGYRFYYENPTNQIFCIMENEALKELGLKVDYSFWEKYDENHSVIRLATDWATTEEEVEALIAIL